ncbi:MAG: type II toxin-antitoxin system HicA family toxin [Candidatus Eremiobacteraeota bacterium]|nr:type II toxin-antitoxin system HicA family toxin [Candidatus Eremiobacteraeota bacterium]
MTFRELRRLLKEDGWRKIRQRGSHEIYRNTRKAGGLIVAGADAKDVPVGILQRTLRQAGLK